MGTVNVNRDALLRFLLAGKADSVKQLSIDIKRAARRLGAMQGGTVPAKLPKGSVNVDTASVRLWVNSVTPQDSEGKALLADCVACIATRLL